MKHELTLEELLVDPMVLTVMRADRVNPGRVGRELRAVGQRLSNGADGQAVPHWFAAGATRQAECCRW